MKNEFEMSLEKFQSAYQRLKEVIEQRPLTEILRDSTIQRFEFMYELCWKTLKLFYKDKGKDLRYPKDAFQEAFNDGIIEDEQVFLEILKDRNQTVHVYSQEEIEKIYVHIVERYLNAFASVLVRLETVDNK